MSRRLLSSVKTADAIELPPVPEPGSSLSVWKEHVKRTQAIIAETRFETKKGWVLAHLVTRFTDDLIRGLLRHVEEEYFRRYPRVDTRLAFIAQGGYGRGEMSPRSDIDLLFVYPQRATPYVEFVTEKVLYTLWDLGFHVGHATRNFRDCVKYGLEDVTVRTALLDHRFLAGDREVFEEFSQILRDEVLFYKPAQFVKAKLDEANERHARFGNSTNVVEPHVKEGEGGMRDLHTALWLGKVKFRADDFYGLFQKGIIPKSDVQALERGWDFLLRVRHELHLRTNKKHDIINFELTAPIAEALGFKDRGATLAAEAFMQRYYYHARMILHVTKGILARCQQPPEGAWRGRFGKIGIKDIGHGFRTYRHELIVGDKSLNEEPSNMMRAFFYKQKYKVPFSRSTYELLRRHARKIDAAFRTDPDVNGMFLEMMGNHENLSAILLEMNETRILGQYIPEWRKLFCRAQYQLYHRYTVDVHSCFCVRELERLYAGDESTPEFFRGVAKNIPDRQLMLLSGLLHDIGKGRGKDHSLLGARFVRNIGKRMGLEKRRIDRLVLLVKHHLTMNGFAQRRDVHDRETINEFAQLVGDIENLDMLYVLSYADTRAVGPNVWNEWKSSLLTELYERTRWVLETGDFKGKWIRTEVRERKQAVRNRVEDQHLTLDSDGLLKDMPDRYFLNNQPADIERHIKLMNSLGDEPFVVEYREAEKGVYEIVYVGHDRPGLFSLIAGSFRACELSIVEAQINTLKNGRVLDIFTVAPVSASEVSKSGWQRVIDVLGGALSGDANLDVVLSERARPSLLGGAKEMPRVKSPRIEIDNEFSSSYTIIDVFAYNRFGLLYDLTQVLARHGLSVHLAKVSTAADMVADVFYVRTKGNEKLTDRERLSLLNQALLKVVKEEFTPVS